MVLGVHLHLVRVGWRYEPGLRGWARRMLPALLPLYSHFHLPNSSDSRHSPLSLTCPSSHTLHMRTHLSRARLAPSEFYVSRPKEHAKEPSCENSTEFMRWRTDKGIENTIPCKYFDGTHRILQLVKKYRVRRCECIGKVFEPRSYLSSYFIIRRSKVRVPRSSGGEFSGERAALGHGLLGGNRQVPPACGTFEYIVPREYSI